VEGSHVERDELSSELTKERKAIGCKWVYAKKQESQNGAIVRNKARLVAKGYTNRMY